MSVHVSVPSKLFRAAAYSAYLSIILSFAIFFFFGANISANEFLFSTAYFLAILLFLAITKNIHFPMLVNRSSIKNPLYKSRHRHHYSKTLLYSAIASILLLAMSIAAFLMAKSYIHAAALAAILILIISFLFSSYTEISVAKEGMFFDYGAFVALLRWNEISSISLKGNSAVISIEGKNVKRRIAAEHPEAFRKAVSKVSPFLHYQTR